MVNQEPTTALAQATAPDEPRRRSHADRIADLEQQFEVEAKHIRQDLETQIDQQNTHIQTLHKIVDQLADALNEVGIEVGFPEWRPTLHREQDHSADILQREAVPVAVVTNDRSTRVRRTDRFLRPKA